MMYFNVPATHIGSPQIDPMQIDMRTRRNTVAVRRSTMSAECSGQAAPPFALAFISRNVSPDTIPTALSRVAIS